LQKANNDLEQQLTVKKAAINDLKNLEGLQTVFVQRLFSLDKLLAEKDNDIYLLLDWLQKNMQSNVSLVKLTQKDKLVSLYLEASDAPAFNTFMNAFSEEIKQETFPFQNKIEITSVNRTKEGLYDLVISLANQPASHEPEK
jgi:hypothetical protein